MQEGSATDTNAKPQISALLETAIEFEQRGCLRDAEQIYLTVLAFDPDRSDALHRMGVLRQRQGRKEDAVRLIRRALAGNPKSAYAQNDLGNVLLELRRPADALKCYARAIAEVPDFAEAHGNLAATLAEVGEHDSALVHYETALRIKPEFPEALNNYGVLLQRLGRRHESVVQFEQAIACKPQYPDALNNLGAALLALGVPEKAIEYCSRALALRPEFPEACNSIGNALVKLDRPEEAITQFKATISLRPRFAEAHNNLGVALDAIGDVEGAVACFQTAAALDNSYADPHENLGGIHTRYGRLVEAQLEFERALELVPGNTNVLAHLVGLKRFQIDDPHIQAMERASEDQSVADNERICLHFALTKAYIDFNDHDSAAGHMVKGNFLRRQQITYDEKATLGELSRIRELFTADLMQRYSGAGNPSDVPIFIVGMPRSGTTLIEQVLASHGDVFGAGELPYFSEGVARLPDKMESMLQYPEFAPVMTPDWLSRLGDDYLRVVKAAAPAAPRITDKMLANFRVAGLIHLAFPNARIIHARRDPIDNCLSCYSILFAEGQVFTYDLRELGRLYKGYERLMAHWHDVLPRGVMIDVQYEELVENFESESRRILAHCGLEWSPACLDFHKTSRAVRTASAMQVRQPLYSSAVGRWRPYEKMLQPLLVEFGLGSNSQ